MARKGSRAANWRIVGIVDAAPRGRARGVGGEAGDGNAGAACHGSECPRSRTMFCSSTSRSDLAGPAVAGKSTAFSLSLSRENILLLPILSRFLTLT